DLGRDLVDRDRIHERQAALGGERLRHRDFAGELRLDHELEQRLGPFASLLEQRGERLAARHAVALEDRPEESLALLHAHSTRSTDTLRASGWIRNGSSREPWGCCCCSGCSAGG